MNPLSHYRRLITYNGWANRAVLNSLRTAGDPPPKAVIYLGHVLAAERIWLGRLEDSSPAVSLWPEPDLDACAVGVEEMTTRWHHYADGLDDAGLDRPVTYTNLRGQQWTDTVADILTHVMNHASYHRGQVATELGANGYPAAETDFILAVRLGLLPGGA